jgi:hypothetical protein
VCTIINDILGSRGYLGELLSVGKLKGIDDFDLGDVNVRGDMQVAIRFNSFENTLEAFNCLQGAMYGETVAQKIPINVNF